jgi:AraC-like DNA-binding protein
MLEVIWSNISNPGFGKDEFASEMNVSSSLLYKKIKSITGLSPIEFIKTVRLNHAMDLLRTHKYTINDISEQCGFANASYFSTVFKKHFGKTASETEE